MSPIGPQFFPPLGPARGSSGSFSAKGWDKCVLAGQAIKSKARMIGGGEVQLKIDRKPKKGANGANPTSGGMDPQPLEIEFLTYSDEEREELHSIIAPYRPQPNKVPKPVSIDFPPLRFVGISAVIIVGVGPMVPIEGRPMQARAKIKFLHWLPTSGKDATTTPSGAPVRKPTNVRARKPPPTPPTEQAGFCGPPANLVKH